MTPDIYIIQKQTALERYTRRPLNIDFFEYLGKAGEDVEGLVEAHEEHVRARESVLETLTKQNISYVVMNLDELHHQKLGYFSDEKKDSGLLPAKGLVLSLGGDGTLLHASHFVGGSVTLLGVNSSLQHSVGHLCAASPKNFEKLLTEVLQGKLSPTPLRRLKVAASNLHSLPLGLNDVLFANRHPGSTARYQITIKSKAGEDICSERHLSSGLWISSPAGSTAAISSYGLPRLPLTSHRFLLAVREPYLPPGNTLQLLKREFEGESEYVDIFCRIRQGLVCVDGADSCAHLGFGDSIEVSLPSSCALRLVVPHRNT